MTSPDERTIMMRALDPVQEADWRTGFAHAERRGEVIRARVRLPGQSETRIETTGRLAAANARRLRQDLYEVWGRGERDFGDGLSLASVLVRVVLLDADLRAAQLPRADRWQLLRADAQHVSLTWTPLPPSGPPPTDDDWGYSTSDDGWD